MGTSFIRWSVHKEVTKRHHSVYFQNMKIWKYTFCREFNWDFYWNFYEDDIITVMSLVLRMQSVSAVFCPAVFFWNSQVLNSIIGLNEKSEQVQQEMCLNAKHYSTYRPNSCKHLSHNTPVWPHEGIDQCDRCIGCPNNTVTRLFHINNTFSTMSKLFTQNMYCWTCKILVTIYWTHLRLNGICTKSFAHSNEYQNAVPYGMISMATLPYLVFINDITVTSS